MTLEIVTPDLIALPIPKADADSFIKLHHYSGTVVWASNVHIGLLSKADSSLVGVIQFGPAMNPKSGHKIVRGATPATWTELNRMAFTEAKPRHAASQAISAATRLLRQLKPAVEWIQSFADERCKKFGAVYQAASFLYCGSHIGRFVEIDGEIYHQSMMSRPLVDKRGWGCGPKVRSVLARRHKARPIQFRQFRYIRPLTKQARTNLLLPVLPYPKPGEAP